MRVPGQWQSFNGPGRQTSIIQDFPGGSDGKGFACNVGDLDSIPGLGRSLGEGNGNPLQHSHLANPHGQRSLADYSYKVAGCKVGVAKSQTQLSNEAHTHTSSFQGGCCWLHIRKMDGGKACQHTCARTLGLGHTRLQGRLENIVQLCGAQEKEEKGFCGQLATFTTCPIQILPQQNKRYYIKSDYGFWGCQKHSHLQTIRTDSAQVSIYASSQ